MHFLALLMRHPETYWNDFRQTHSVDAHWDNDERINFWDQKVKGQGHSMTKGPAGRGIQSSTLCIKF